MVATVVICLVTLGAGYVGFALWLEKRTRTWDGSVDWADESWLPHL